jgi:hypothetical protein
MKTLYNQANLFNKANKSFDSVWKEIISDGREFEKLFDQYKLRIIELVPQYSGFPWKQFAEPLIYIYPVKYFPSFSHPLTLHIRKDPIINLGMVIHELAHNNMPFEFPSEELQETIMTSVAVKILGDFALDSEKYLILSRQIFNERFGAELSIPPWFGDQSVKQYLMENKNNPYSNECESCGVN